jgi:hypothetical protein
VLAIVAIISFRTLGQGVDSVTVMLTAGRTLTLGRSLPAPLKMLHAFCARSEEIQE